MDNTTRKTTIIDYSKAICKPFQETGYCGYGDTCKFLHERFVKEVEIKECVDETESKICKYCNNNFQEKVVTDCGHSFCLICAIKQFKSEKKCFECRSYTYGRFTPV